MTRSLLAAVLASAVLMAGGIAAGAADAVLRGDIVAARDTLTLRDLVDGAPVAIADTPLFRAPALGTSGTIQTRRIVMAVEALGLTVQTGGRVQVAVTRAARQVGPGEIEAAIKKRLAADFGLDQAATGIAFDGSGPILMATPDQTAEPVASEVSYDRRSRRIAASVWLGPSATERRAQIRVAGSAIDLVEVIVAARAVERGQEVKTGDLQIERRPRDVLAPDTVHDGSVLEGRVLRRTVTAGAIVRPADLIRPELVARGDLVIASYQAPGIILSMRLKANEAGTLGDSISVLNPQSKKVLQAVVTGPGRVLVGGATPGRVASADAGRSTP